MTTCTKNLINFRNLNLILMWKKTQRCVVIIIYKLCKTKLPSCFDITIALLFDVHIRRRYDVDQYMYMIDFQLLYILTRLAVNIAVNKIDI